MPRSWCAVLLVSLLAPALGALLAPAAQAASATAISTLPPDLVGGSGGATGLVGASAVYLNGASYVFGGRFPDGRFSDAVLKYDVASGATTRVATMPTGSGATDGGRYSGAAVAMSGAIYYFGGAIHVEASIPNSDPSQPPTKAQIPVASADIIKFDPASSSIQIMAADHLAAPAFGLGATATSINGAPVAYVFGGYRFEYPSTTGNGRLDTISTFDPSASPGGRLLQGSERLPYPLQDMGVAALGNKMYLFGGVGNNDNATNPCPTYESDNQSVPYAFCQTNNILPIDGFGGRAQPELMRHMPYTAQFVQAAVLQGKAYVPGGCLSDQSAASSVIVFQPGAGPEVSTFPAELPEGIFGAGVATDGSTITLFGGRRDCSYEGYSNLTSSIVRVDPNPGAPYPPHSLAWSPLSPGVHLSWVAPTYDGGSPVTAYRVYRSTPTGNETKLGQTSTLAFDDPTAKAGAAYTYRVTAINAIGESSPGARINVNAETSAPSAVRNFRIDAGPQKAILYWSPPLDDGGTSIADYIVYETTNGAQTQVTTTGPRTTQATITGLTNGNTYSYTVVAHNLKGDGPKVKSLSVTPLDVPDAPTSFSATADLDAGTVSLSWGTPGGLTPDRFIVYRSLAAGDLGSPINQSVTDTTFLDASPQRGHTYYYAVRAAHAQLMGPATEQEPVSIVHPPGAPLNVKAISQQGSVRVQWDPPTDTGDADPATLLYAISRAKAGEAPRIIATDVAGTNYVDTTASVNVSYTYTVATLNPLISPPSAPVTAAPKPVVNQPPVASLSAVPSVAAVGDPVQLDASLSYDPDGVIRSYIFDFGDGTEPVHQSAPTVTHAYVANGTYTATVIASDDRNDASKATTHLVIGQPPGQGGSDSQPSVTPPTPVVRPGSGTPKSPIPAPGVGLTLLGLAAVSLVWAARHRPK